jgi:hypothetical protein
MNRSALVLAFASGLAACAGTLDDPWAFAPEAPASPSDAASPPTDPDASPSVPAARGASVDAAAEPADARAGETSAPTPAADAAGGPAPQSDASANASKCPGSTFALCDGFESGQIDPATWKMASDNGGGGMIVVDNVRAMRGTHALHAHLPKGPSGPSAAARIYETKTFPALSHALYGRVFVYILGVPPGKHSPFVAGEETAPSAHYYGTEEKNGGQMYAVQGGAGIDEGFGSATVIGHDKWVCLEWYYGGAGETRTWLDGTELTDIHETSFQPASFTDILVGLADEDLSTIVATTGYDVWFDEIAIAAARVGCND